MKSPMLVRGHLGIGDCIHQRAVLRELMVKHDLWLEPAYYAAMYHDLVAQGLKLIPKAGPYSNALDRDLDRHRSTKRIGPRFARGHINYNAAQIRHYGSILAAQFASVGLPMPARPDFSLPVPYEWCEWARTLPRNGKPLLVLRPLIRNSIWHREKRYPDPATYAALFEAIRRQFYVVSIANLANGREALIGPPLAADICLHDGELSFATMAGLFASAALVFANPGFAPVLAQAVGTPVICIYGGNESSKSTQQPGMHLAPTLAIEPDVPCDCHDPTHACNKHITFAPALEKVVRFVDEYTTTGFDLRYDVGRLDPSRGIGQAVDRTESSAQPGV